MTMRFALTCSHACNARSLCISACCLHAGTTFKYSLASLLLPQDQTTTQPPPFKFDTALGKPGFVDPSGAPVTVTLTTKVRAHVGCCSHPMMHAWQFSTLAGAGLDLHGCCQECAHADVALISKGLLLHACQSRSA